MISKAHGLDILPAPQKVAKTWGWSYTAEEVEV